MKYRCDGLGGLAYDLHSDDTCGGEPFDTFDGIGTGQCIQDAGGYYMMTCPSAGSEDRKSVV
jgi:hypothetical protein